MNASALLRLATVAAASLGLGPITHAQSPIYREIFGLANGNPNAGMNVFGWAAYSTPTANNQTFNGTNFGIAGETGATSSPSNQFTVEGVVVGLPGISNGAGPASPTSGRTFLGLGGTGGIFLAYTLEFPIDRTVYTPTTFTWEQRNDGPALGVAVRIDGAWYASAAVPGGGGGTGWSTATVDFATTTWTTLDFTPSTTVGGVPVPGVLAVGVETPLPSGNITGFGLFGPPARGTTASRIDAFTVNALTNDPGTSAPTLASVTPASGPAGGGTSFTITGTAFSGATSVTVGGVAATNVTVIDATTLTATTPAGSPGVAAIAVTTPAGTGTLPSAFTYLTAIQSWFSGYSLPTDGTGTGALDADPDADGVANLLEYALDTSPTDATDADLPAIAVASGRLQLTFLRARADVTYLVEVSSDLSTWDNLTYTPVAVGQDQTVTDTVDLSAANAPRRFLRLRVSQP